MDDRVLQYHTMPITHYTPVDVSYGNKDMTTPLTHTLKVVKEKFQARFVKNINVIY